MNTRKTLIVHHFEETWRTGLERSGITPEKMRYNIADFLLSGRGRGINHVIFTKFQSDDIEEIHEPLIEFLDRRDISYEFQIFPYDMFKEMFSRDEVLIPSTKDGADEDNVVYIESWHQDLANDQVVMLCGAFESECVRDAEDMLDFVRPCNYVKLDDLVVGTGKCYEPAICPDTLADEYRNLCDQINILSDPDECTPGSLKQANSLIKGFLKDKKKGLLLRVIDQDDIGGIRDDQMQFQFDRKLNEVKWSNREFPNDLDF